MFWARAAPKHCYLHVFGRPVLPNTIIHIAFALSYWWDCKCRRDPGPAKSIAIFNVLGQGCFKTSLFTCFWEASAPKHDYLRNICFSYCQVIASSLEAVFDSVALFVEFTLGVLFVAHVPASQFEYGVRTSHYSCFDTVRGDVCTMRSLP